ncbi:MAG: formylglycine-generating enzyme family protein [Deltaproteobacteria bacterium]|nr:formylglycine-generating enzyme family protein [Deltaproteobacteria bacterium]
MTKHLPYLVAVLMAACWSADSADTDDAGIDEDSDAGVPVLLECDDNGNCDQAFCDQVIIPGSVFHMGSDEAPKYDVDTDVVSFFQIGDETPSHPVSLGAFCIDKYEVTYERYLACVKDGACSPGGHEYQGAELPLPEGVLVVDHYPDECEVEEDPVGTINRCPHHAVNCKTHEQAREYCEWIGRRLCTEAEWERSASGPPPRRTYPWGEEEPDENRANMGDSSTDYVEPVDICSGGSSKEGVLNLLGNVYEWVHDYYAPYAPPDDGSPRDNPTGPDSGETRSVRGGCFFEGGYSTSTTRAMQVPSFDFG